MPAFGDFSQIKFEDGQLYVSMVPNLALGGLTLQATISKRFGGTPIVTRSMASGFYGVSGMNIVNSGEGQFTVQVNASDLSGYDPGNFACQVKRMDSGFQTVAFQGFFNLGAGNL